MSFVDEAGMNWLTLIGIVVLIAAVAAIFGLKPKGSRPVANTRLMGMGRIALVVMAIIIIYLGVSGR